MPLLIIYPPVLHHLLTPIPTLSAWPHMVKLTFTIHSINPWPISCTTHGKPKPFQIIHSHTYHHSCILVHIFLSLHHHALCHHSHSFNMPIAAAALSLNPLSFITFHYPLYHSLIARLPSILSHTWSLMHARLSIIHYLIFHASSTKPNAI